MRWVSPFAFLMKQKWDFEDDPENFVIYKSVFLNFDISVLSLLKWILHAKMSKNKRQ